MRDQQNVDPELVIREGEPVHGNHAQIADDREVGVLVLGAGRKQGPRSACDAADARIRQLADPDHDRAGRFARELEAIT